jgi:hypothetical protein
MKLFPFFFPLRPFTPFYSHRTLAEVDETERLLALPNFGGTRELRLAELLAREDANNPPPIEPDGAA